ncbi:hypothetical protein [Fusobacterium polymorphum]|uniref:hypothetical protein n=1 Tax=Fusobacterium nucleatum subsp. polymorphum TaxID=76857 RepID=UPI00071EF466|nr:hypothetical protein [Fusobacterium polymorphum]ALQ41526.1 hypothetical protein RN93_01580 [Fusobacterium polymorphum]BEO96989.1 hypothetical protein FNCP10_18440 [Fusobacterium nucleatum]BEP07006.1 hypothetical protein FNSP10_03800 [Fusobacterium nucleatum]
MNKNYVGTYGVIKKNGGIDLLCSENGGEGNIFFSILKCIEENDNYLKVIVIGKGKEHLPKIAIIKKPKFDVGDKVKLIKYPNEKATVRLIIWHEKNRRIFYILDVEENKKRSNSWYYEDENKFEKINE